MSVTSVTQDSVAPRSVRPAASGGRLDSVDLLRGLVMVIMALDHTRDYFTEVRFDPTDLSQAGAGLFLTRWVTHFCAPVFVLLAGTGAYLAGARGKSRPELTRFLLSRGLWLVLLEFTVVRVAWMFNLDYQNLLFVQVIWAIGASMVVLAGLVYLPLPAIAAVGLAMILTHNLFDGVRLEALGPWAALWGILHVQGPVTLPGGVTLQVLYPLVPWVGVMAVGYAFGALLQRPTEERRRLLLRLGGALTLGFVALRALNVYGDPAPWEAQGSPERTALAFLDTTKYPPSLLFLLMTLGPALLLLAWAERLRGPVARFLVVYGRVPLFFYVLHLYLIHGLALGVAVLMGFEPEPFLQLWLSFPPEWGFGLPVVYLLWGGVVLALFPLCRWFAGVKARRREAWLSYL